MNNQKGFSPIIILIIIILLGGGIFAWQYIQLTEETADWETYKNGDYAFEVKYPIDWQLNVADWLSPTDRTKSDVRFYPSWVDLDDINAKDPFIGINVIDNFQGESIPAALSTKSTPCKNVIINDLEFCKLAINTEDPFADMTIYATQKDNMIYSLTMSCDLPCNFKSETKIFDQMLSTFKFVNTDVISTEVIKYTPELPSEIKQGSCWINSLSAQRKDAWRCIVNNMISDPCFTVSGSNDLVCDPNPINNDKGFLLKLTQPLPEAGTIDNFGKGWGWLIELEDGNSCSFVTGATGVIDGKRANYICSDDSWVLGDLQTGIIWKAEKAEIDFDSLQAKSIKLVPIRKVWQ